MKELLQISNLDGDTLLARLNFLKNEIYEIKSHLQPKEPTQFLTRSQVSELLSISLTTVDEWSAKGILTAYRLANRVYFKRHEVEAALQSIKAKGGKA